MFEHRLLEARKKKGLTQKQIAEKAGIHIASYSAYENNKKMPPIDILVKISDVLEISIDWLCNRNNETVQVVTLGDIARSIYKIEKAMNEWQAHSCYYLPSGEETMINIGSATLTEFYKTAEKFLDLSLQVKEGRELYELWLEKEFQELDKRPLCKEEA